MDRKSIIGVAFGVVLVAYSVYQNIQYQSAVQKEQPPAAAEASPSAIVAAPTPAASATPLAQAELKPEPPAVEKTEKVRAALVDYTFTNLGGGIATVKLLQYEGEKPGDNVVLNAFGKHPLGALNELVQLPGSADEIPQEPQDKAYTVSFYGSKVVCERDAPQGIHIKKTFSLPENGAATRLTQSAADYSVQMEVEFSNRGATPAAFPSRMAGNPAGTGTDYYVYVGSAEPIHPSERSNYTNFGWYRDGKGTFIDVTWFDPGKVPILGIPTSSAHSVYEQSPGGVVWAGVKSQYFSTILSPDSPAQGVWASRFPINADSKAIQGKLQMPGFTLNPGEIKRQTFSLYTGPNEYRLLAQLSKGESGMMNSLGWFKWISLTLLSVMNWLHDKLPYHSYAVAIVILTFAVRGALWPVQGAATKSMKRMQLVQPEMTKLKEKYKDDPTRMNTEMMKLYKDYKINPFAGCLPMLIQIPIFIGFYSMLGSAVELRGSHFLWIHDLSQPDTVFRIAGFPVNILPLCMAATMIWQMSISPKSGDPAQQKMMMFMPLMFVFICYNFASALALYYTISNILSIFQLYVTRNQAVPVLERPGTKSHGRNGGRKPGRRQ